MSILVANFRVQTHSEYSGPKNEARRGSLLRASHQAEHFWGPVLGPVLEPVLELRFGAIPGFGWELQAGSRNIPWVAAEAYEFMYVGLIGVFLKRNAPLI